MPAGPTEIVVTSEAGDPAGIAADLVAQAEHDPEALAVLITSNPTLAEAVMAEVKSQAKGNAIANQIAGGAGLHICDGVSYRSAGADQSAGAGAPDGRFASRISNG